MMKDKYENIQLKSLVTSAIHLLIKLNVITEKEFDDTTSYPDIEHLLNDKLIETVLAEQHDEHEEGVLYNG